MPTQEKSFYEILKEGKVEKVELEKVISTKDTWKTPGGVKIISLVGIQKIANQEGIVEKKFTTDIVPTEGNKQQHGINIWVGFKGDDNPDDWFRGSGEASMLNTGKVVATKEGGKRYEEFGSIDAKYRYSMADKRAYCRAVLKMVRLYGVYSEVEAKEFIEGKPSQGDYDY